MLSKSFKTSEAMGPSSGLEGHGLGAQKVKTTRPSDILLALGVRVNFSRMADDRGRFGEESFGSYRDSHRRRLENS
jgi:hypothetical protein